jgi:hypothetical protein
MKIVKKMIKTKLWILPVPAVIVLAVVVFGGVGVVGALNGWFGGGSSTPSDTMTRGLVGYWNFDEGSGAVAHDSSDNGKNGVAGNVCVAGHNNNGNNTCTGIFYPDAHP